ncbi:MAG TPA: hypothetical protein ENK55_11855 [Actinobacteria bacterium]|nr:hypothetical protein [Actinomycetota bacterium]
MHVPPDPVAIRRLRAADLDGLEVMVALLRLREEADASAAPDLHPGEPIFGVEASRRDAVYREPLLADVRLLATAP